MTRPPKRLLETETGSLRESLSVAKSQVPSDAQLAALAERLGQLGIVIPDPSAAPPPAAPPAAAPPATAPAAKSLGVGTKVGLGVTGLGTAVVLAFALTRSPSAPPGAQRPEPRPAVQGSAPTTPVTEPSSAPRNLPVRSKGAEHPPSQPRTPSQPPPHATRQEQPEQPAPSAQPSPPAPSSFDTSPPDPSAPLNPALRQHPTSSTSTRKSPTTANPSPETPPPLRSHPAQSTTTPHAANPPEPDTTPSSEVGLLKRARNAVASNPAQALALARRHAAEFPNGAFAQERDFIAISALVRLGRTSEAKALASSFRARYRRSAYLPQLERLVGPE